MPELYDVAGTKIYIGGSPINTKAADFVAGDFSSVTWTEIDGFENYGGIGDTPQINSTDLINRNRTLKTKGTRNGGARTMNFAVIDQDAGQLALIAAETNKNNYPFKLVFPNATGVIGTATVTITIASPGVITWTAHGFAVGQPVVFTTTASLPTGLTAGTTYYVKTVLSADTFTVAATPSGSAIATSGTQSGTHTGSGGAGEQRLFLALVASVTDTGGGANTKRMMSAVLEVNSNAVKVPAV